MQIITKRDRNIYYLLLQKVNDPYLAKYIYNFMNEMETLDYHIERWETISYKYFRSFEMEHSTMTRKPYSYVFNGEKYICEADRDLSFYYETGISYQIRDLLLMIIKDPDKTNEDIVDKGKLDWMKEDDLLYSILAKKIMRKIIHKINLITYL